MTTTGLEGLVAARFITESLVASLALQAILGPSLADRVAEGAWTPPPDDPGHDLPWITFTVMEPQDVVVVGMAHLMSNVMVQVRVTARGTSYTAVAPTYAAAHQAINAKANVSLVGAPVAGLILTCHRLSAVHYPEKAAGIEYRHLGGLYALAVQ